VPGQIFQGIRRLVEARQRCLALHAEASAEAVWSHNEAVFGLMRQSARGRLLVLANFGERPQSVPAYRLRELDFAGPLVNRLDERRLDGWGDLELKGYEALWLERSQAPA
jgi:amylosucrase